MSGQAVTPANNPSSRRQRRRTKLTTETPSYPKRIRDRLAGHHILLTGSTGFLAKALLEKLLRCVDTIGGVHLLVRPRSDGTSARRRVERDVLRSKAFDRLRASMGSGFDGLCQEKIHVVTGDLTQHNLGLDDDTYQALTDKLTLLINSAATVTFDERIDLAVELNSLGAGRLLQLARDCGGIPFMHVSTCYVSGIRTGQVVEDFSAPPKAQDTLPRLGGSGAFDLDALVESMRKEADEIKSRFGTNMEQCRRQLIEAGMRRARSYGWNDTYTFTKWIGEQRLIRDHGDVPVVVFRPAIIESSLDEPAPGWIDGLRMADPIIVAYGKGRLSEFPAASHVPMDFIPVDFVVNAMLATLPVGDGLRSPEALYQCCSSGRNPLFLRDLRSALEEAFRLRPMNDDEGLPIKPKPLRVVRRDSFIRRWRNKQRLINGARRFLTFFNKTSPRARRLASASRKIDQLIYFAKIYSPYTHLDCRFQDDSLLEAVSWMHPDDVVEFPFDPSSIDWRDYIVNRHVPGVRSFVLGTGGEPTRGILAAQPSAPDDRPPAELLDAANLFEVFRRSAEKHADKPALQVRRKSRWIRYTYREALQASGTIMTRISEQGLEAGDCVAICGESSPEWALTYLAIMRAGMTAVPLDPQTPPEDAWEAARFAGAKLLCAGSSTYQNIAQKRSDGDVRLIEMGNPFIPAPGASRDLAPEPVRVDDTSVASILFTSGTTVAPKAVQLTHRNFIANAAALVKTHRIYPTDEFLSVLPMYHAFEFTGGFMVPMTCGATITYVDQLKGSEITTAINATGTTVMLVVPRLLQMFHDSIQGKIAVRGLVGRTLYKTVRLFSELTGRKYARKLFSKIHEGFGGRLRMFVSGGSRLDPELLDEFDAWGFAVYEGYGMTETSPVLAVNPTGGIKAGSVGRALPNVEIEIRNKNLENLGEVWVSGPNVMTGYLDNPEATSDVLVDGWLRTGDLGRIDEDGYLHLTGRSKDLIITSAGKNVYPDEVEHRYKDLPYTKELCVLAMPSTDGLGDAVHAVVVVDPGSAPELDRSSLQREIRLAAAVIAESLPDHQRIAAMHFWEEDLPKTSTLKAKRGAIKNILQDEVSASGMAGDEDEIGSSSTVTSRDEMQVEKIWGWEALRSILAGQSSKQAEAIRPSMNLLLDMGIDSIGKIDVIGQVEACFNMKVTNQQASTVARVADLIAIIGDRKPTSAARRDPSTWQRRITISDRTPALDGKLPSILRPVRWTLRGGVGTFMHTYVRVRAVARENIPKTGGFILAPNHSSHLDSPSVLTAVGGLRRVWVAGAEDYFFSSAFRRFLFGKVLDTIPFDRKSDGLAGLQRCAETLHHGDGLLLFPEGTRSISGRLGPFKVGTAVLAIERGVPIVPVHIHRAYDLFRKGQRVVRPGVVTVSFGKPIHPPECDGVVDHYAAFCELTEQVRLAVVELGKGAPA